MEKIAEFFNSTSGQLLAAAIAVVLFLVLLGFLNRKTVSPRVIAYSAMLICLATVMSFVGISFEFGGSITFLSMFFVILAGLWFGPSVGLSAALTYGLLQFAIKPQFYHPVQVLLDYILGFSALGVSGFFRGKKYAFHIGVIVPMLLRLVFSTISGVAFFWEYAGDMHPLIYSITYNGGYIFPEMALTLIIISFPQVRAALEEVRKRIMA